MQIFRDKIFFEWLIFVIDINLDITNELGETVEQYLALQENMEDIMKLVAGNNELLSVII